MERSGIAVRFILVLDNSWSRDVLRQAFPRLMAEGLDLMYCWRIARLKQGTLHPGPRASINRSPAMPGWLHHKVDMRRLPPGVRPQTDVDLVCLGEDLDSLGDSVEERTKVLTLRLGEVPNMEAVAERFRIRVPTPSGPVQCSTTQCAVAQSLPPGSGSAPAISRQA